MKSDTAPLAEPRCMYERRNLGQECCCEFGLEQLIRRAMLEFAEQAREIAQRYRDSANDHLSSKECAELIRNRIVELAEQVKK